MDSTKAKVLRGSLDQLPTLNSRVVRIFISSTFTDTREERNILLEEVYPKLQTYCKQHYGLEFQVIDMRWGVPEEAADDHATSELCIQEILNCQKLSTGPNFVTFLNQRHGFRVLQPVIEHSEYVLLINTLREMGEDVSLFETWYRQDNNACPPVLVLQPISSIIPEYRNKDKAAINMWTKISDELRNKLKLASRKCHEAGKMTEEQKHKYFMSVTEEEIVHGILKSPGNPLDHCLCFIRIIEDIEENLGQAKVWRFIDMSGQKINEEAQAILRQLRDDKIVKVMDSSQIARSYVKWHSEDGINRDVHSDYLQSFSQTFYENVKKMLDNAVSTESKLSKDDLYIEVLQHSVMAKDRCAMFHGREEILDRIISYLKQDHKEPFTIYGPSGSGKTSIIAEAARRVPFEYHKDAVIILRFLGTSPDSSNIRRLLQSVCSQIVYNTGGDVDDIPQEYDELVLLFQDLVTNYKSDKPMVILLDSLDQLTQEHAAHKLRWLPRKTTKNVRIVLSSYIESQEILTTLKSLFLTQNFVLVPKLGEELGFQILKVWLEGNNRSLTSEQFEIVQKAFSDCSYPLYVKLVYDNILKWRSYTPVEKCILKSTVKESIATLFGQLEGKHGKMFVARAFAYLTASATGLSELELEDVMSIDDVLLTEVFKFHIPPVRRIPSLLFARLKYDVSTYIVEKEVDETRVAFWYHRQFYETSQERYLSDENFTREIHSNLADYFLGKWHNEPKPFKYTPDQMKRLGITSPEGSAGRKVSDQPIKFKYVDKNGFPKVRFNKRKLNRLPYHLSNAKRSGELSDVCLFNYQFLVAKMKATSVAQVLSDFLVAGLSSNIVHRILKTCQSSLQRYPDSLAFELSGHLLSYVTEKKTSPEKSLVTECLLVSNQSDKPTPYLPCYNVPSEALLYKLENHKLSYGSINIVISKDSKHLLALGENNVVLSWDLMIGELESELEILTPDKTKLNIMESDISKNLAYFTSSYQKSVNPFVIVDISSTSVKKSLMLEKTYPGVGMPENLKYIPTETRIFSLYVGHSADVFSLEDGTHVHQFDILADDMILSPNMKLIMFHLKSTKTYILFSTESLKEEQRFDVADFPQSILFTPSGQEVIVLLKDAGVVKMVNIHPADGKPGKELSEIKAHDGLKILSTAISLSGNFVILRTENGFMVWNYKSGKIIREFLVPESIKPDHRVLDMFGFLTADDKTFVVGYEGHVLMWDTTEKALKACVEASKSKLSAIVIDQSGTLAMTTSKRNNSIQVWNLDTLGSADSKFKPLAMKSSPRYISVSKTGDIAIVRGNDAKDMAVLDLREGRITKYISELYDVMRPKITPDGAHAVLRGYDGDHIIKVWSTSTGQLVCALPLNSLEVKHYICSNREIIVYTHSEDKKGADFSFYDIISGKLIRTLKVNHINIGDMILDQNGQEDELIISKHQEGTDIAITDLVVINLSNGEDLYSVPNIRPTRTQPLRPGESVFFTEQVLDKSEFLILIDTKARKIVKKNKVEQMPEAYLSLSHDGRYGIDRVLNLYDLESLKHVHQFDVAEKAAMLKNVKTKATAPKMLPDGCHAVWLNIRAGIVKVANVDKKVVESVIPVHSIPINLDVSTLGMVIVGCEDGRIMLMKMPEKETEVKKEFSSSLKDLTNRLYNVSKKLYTSAVSTSVKHRQSTQNSKKSSVCTIA